MVFTGFSLFSVLFLLLTTVSGLLLPMKNPNGQADLDSVIDHVTLMEQTITRLETQVQTGNNELTTVKADLQTTKQDLKASKDETTAVKAELRLAETAIGNLKRDLQKLPDPVEFSQLKTDFKTLKANHNALVQQINFSVIDAVSADVKTNTRDIQSLKSEMRKTESEVNNTYADVANLTSEVLIISRQLNQSINAVSTKADIVGLKSQLTDVVKSINTTTNNIHLLETQLTNVENGYHSFQSKQNITEHELAKCKALAQSTAADLKTVQTQVQTLFTDVTGLHDDLSVIRTKTNKDVAFQVTQHKTPNTAWTTLKFDTVDHNIGDAHNNVTGMFTAPVSGTYIFWANVAFHDDVGNDYIYIKKGSRNLASAFVRIDNKQYMYVASTITTAHLDKGDQVHFTTDSNSTTIHGFGLSSYGGALLHVS